MLQLEETVKALKTRHEDMRRQLLATQKMYWREVHLRNSLKALLSTWWDVGIPNLPPGSNIQDLLMALEAGNLDVNTVLGMSASRPANPPGFKGLMGAPGQMGAGMAPMKGMSGPPAVPLANPTGSLPPIATKVQASPFAAASKMGGASDGTAVPSGVLTTTPRAAASQLPGSYPVKQEPYDGGLSGMHMDPLLEMCKANGPCVTTGVFQTPCSAHLAGGKAAALVATADAFLNDDPPIGTPPVPPLAGMGLNAPSGLLGAMLPDLRSEPPVAVNVTVNVNPNNPNKMGTDPSAVRPFASGIGLAGMRTPSPLNMSAAPCLVVPEPEPLNLELGVSQTLELLAAAAGGNESSAPLRMETVESHALSSGSM